MKDELKKILMERDGLDDFEAGELIADAQMEIDELIDSGASLDEIEDTVYDYFSLEPDYVVAFLN